MFKINSPTRHVVVLLFVFLSAILTLTSRAALAGTVLVDAKAAGKFGAWDRKVDEESLEMAKAHVFTGPGKITIRVEGKISLHPSEPRFKRVGPKGLNYPRPTRGCIFPLEEALVDAKGMGALGPAVRNAGSVFGAFVPESTVNAPGFLPINNDFPNGGISSDRLFLVGKGVDFSADEPGTLFLGINDCRPHNNSGSFKVTITPKGSSSS